MRRSPPLESKVLELFAAAPLDQASFPSIATEILHVDLHLVRLASALAALREPSWDARAAREIVQSPTALRLDPRAVRALAAELRQAEARAAALPR